MADTPIIPLTVTLGGAYLAWFGVHYWRTDVKWPTDPIKAVLTGKKIPTSTPPAPAIPATGTSGSSGGSGTSFKTGVVGPPPISTTLPSSGQYSTAQLQALWTANGGNPATARLAAAIAMAESSGDPASTSGNPDGGTNVGLWQLDTPGGVGHGYTVTQLKDANTNARITVMATKNGIDWGQWETFVTGAYKKYY